MKAIILISFVFFYVFTYGQAGALDSNFNNNGKYIDTRGFSMGSTAAFEKVALQPDEKIVLAGYYHTYASAEYNLFVERLNKDGRQDINFGDQGRITCNISEKLGYINPLAGIAIQTDGKILIAGTVQTENFVYDSATKTDNQADIFVLRLNNDGSRDNSFGKNGLSIFDFSRATKNPLLLSNKSSDYCNGLILRPDGKVLLFGSVYNNKNYKTVFQPGDRDAIIVQIKSDGSLDPNFSRTGFKILPIVQTDESPSDIAVDNDGKIVLSGTSIKHRSSTYNTFLLRTSADGTLDKAFNKTGWIIKNIDTLSGNHNTTIAVQQDKKIILGGTQYFRKDDYNEQNLSGAYLVRYNNNGTLDSTFGLKGKVLFIQEGETNDGNDLVIQNDGKLIQIGSVSNSSTSYQKVFNGNSNYQVLRYSVNGTLDSTFGSFGRTIVDCGNWFGYPMYTGNKEASSRNDHAYSSVIQPDGKIIVVGQSNLLEYENHRGGNGGSAIRLLSDGQNYSIKAPLDYTVRLTDACTMKFSDIDPIIYPDTSLSILKYRLYKGDPSDTYYSLYDSGYGSLSNKSIDIGNYAVLYSSLIDSNQRAVFKLNISGGLPAKALSFDGIDDRVDLINVPPFVSPERYYTFEAWIRVDGFNKNGGSSIFSNQHGKDSGIVVGISSNGFICTYHPSVGDVLSSYKVQLNKWTHIVFIQTPEKLDLYVDGSFIQTLLKDGHLHASTSPKAYFGATTNDNITFSKFYFGLLENVRFWNKAICLKQLQNNSKCVFYKRNYDSDNPSLEFTFDRGMASCENTNLNTLFPYTGDGNQVNGELKNFYLDGPVSNWVAGISMDTCPLTTHLSINAPSDIQLYSVNTACGVNAKYKAIATSSCIDDPQIKYSQSSGTFFPVGTTNVIAQAEDETGEKAGTSFRVTVVDTTPPLLLTKDTTIELDKSGYAYIDPKSVISSLTDNCSTQLEPSYHVSPISFTILGSYEVTVVATDKYGNKSKKLAMVRVLPKRE